MSLNAETLRTGRDRTTRVFRYLEALNQHRNPAKRQIREQLWLLWFSDLPDHSSIRRGVFDDSANSEAETQPRSSPEQQRAGDDFALKVRRPELTRAPSPPAAIAEWLEHGWENPAAEVRIHTSRNEEDGNRGTRIVRFGADPQRLRAFERWKAQRDEWARNERPAREAMKIFEQLYKLHGRIEREAERVELILGDGILSWRRSEGGVYHPVLLQRVQLEFDPTVPEFTVIETEQEVELYSALFHSMSDVDGKTIARWREELDQGGYHPLAGDLTSGFLRSLVVRLSSRGEFISQGVPRGESDDPRIGREPVLFLRTRTLGFATAIERVLEDLKECEDLPNSLLNVVGVETAVKAAEEGDLHTEPWSEPAEILLSKPVSIQKIQTRGKRRSRRVRRHKNRRRMFMLPRGQENRRSLPLRKASKNSTVMSRKVSTPILLPTR